MAPNTMDNTKPAINIYNYNNHEDAPVGLTDEDTTEESPLTDNHYVHRRLQTKHLSMMEGDSDDPMERSSKHHAHHKYHAHRLSYLAGGIGLLILLSIASLLIRHQRGPNDIVSVEQAVEYYMPLEGNSQLKLWFRTWGNPQGIPILFVHGGPGNAIADYTNQRFFDYKTFFVVEIDQRGTGKSQPSVRDGWKNMKYYQDISITKIVADFEQVRKFLKIDKWIVWGGSFGSTLSIHYGELYPESCMAMFLRGLYLDTAEEVYSIYARKAYLDNPKRLKEFDIFFKYLQKSTTKELDPDDAEEILRVYADLISKGDEYASWHWFVFENNLMQINPDLLLDPNRINDSHFREALSISFFETHLWLHGSFDEPPSDLMNPKAIHNLTFPLWVCQGNYDEVCPPQYARRFVDAVAGSKRSPSLVARFLNGTHEDTDPVIASCLHKSLREYVEMNYAS